MRPEKEVRRLWEAVGNLSPKDRKTMDYACGVLDALEWMLGDSPGRGAAIVEEINRGRKG